MFYLIICFIIIIFKIIILKKVVANKWLNETTEVVGGITHHQTEQEISCSLFTSPLSENWDNADFQVGLQENVTAALYCP